MSCKYKTLRISMNTYQKLCKLGNFGESFDELLQRIIPE